MYFQFNRNTLLILLLSLLVLIFSAHRDVARKSTNKLKQRHDLESKLRIQEMISFQRAISLMKKNDYTIKGFFHVSNVHQFWMEVVEELLLILDGRRIEIAEISRFENGTTNKVPFDMSTRYTSLLSVMDSLYIGFTTIFDDKNVTKGSENFKLFQTFIRDLDILPANKRKILLGFNQSVDRLYKSLAHAVAPDNIVELEKLHGGPLTSGEVSTILAMHQYCLDIAKRPSLSTLPQNDSGYSNRRRPRKARRDTTQIPVSAKNHLVVYFHSKGGCCGRSTHQPPYWREFMTAFSLEFPSICLNALLESNSSTRRSYKTCGTNLRMYDGSDEIPPHYSGNFWWSTCEHIASLPSLRGDERYDAFSPEWFPFTVSRNYSIRRDFATQHAKNVHSCEEFRCLIDDRPSFIRFIEGKLQLQ